MSTKNPEQLANLMLQALSERAGHGGALTEDSIKSVLRPYWDNDLMLAILSEHATGVARDVIVRRIKALDRKAKITKVLIIYAIGAAIGLIWILMAH